MFALLMEPYAMMQLPLQIAVLVTRETYRIYAYSLARVQMLVRTKQGPTQASCQSARMIWKT